MKKILNCQILAKISTNLSLNHQVESSKGEQKVQISEILTKINII